MYCATTTDGEGPLGPLVPTAFVAVTVKVKFPPFGRFTVALVVFPETTACAPPGLAVTVYLLIGAPLLFEGLHVTVARPLPPDALTLVGTDGNPAGVNVTVLLGALEPRMFRAVTEAE
jgi:hypothetical protein